MAYFEGEVPVVTTGYNNNDGFGNGWEGLIGLALVFGLINGWGGFGFGGNRGGYGSSPATQADLANGFAQNTLQRGIDDIILGQATMQNFINQGFNGIQNTLTTSFANLNTNLCSLGYNQAQLVNGLSRELSDCCCTLGRSLDGINYNLAKSTCDIIQAGHNDTDRIINYLTNEKISSLQAENAALTAQLSNNAQSNYIIDRLSPCPKPAFIVPNPNCCYANNSCGL